jgi:hypothetical protein
VSAPEGRAYSARAGGVAVGAVALLFVLLVGGWLVRTHVRLLGTDSVAPRLPLPALTPGHRLCITDLVLPAHANAIRLQLQATTPLPVTMRVTAGGRTQVTTGIAPVGQPGGVFRITPFDRDTPITACITSQKVLPSIAGMPAGGSGAGQAYYDKAPSGRLAVAYLRLPARSLLSALPAGARHAALFRAGFVRAWTYALIALLVLAAWAAGLRLVLRENE